MPTLTDHAQEHRVTREQYEVLRDGARDNSRYELLDGEVLVTPSPSFLHQHVLRRIMAALEAVLPKELAMVSAPYDLTLSPDDVLQPDLLIGEFTADRQAMVTPPLVVIEVLSPSTWRRDLGVKRDAYARAGVEHYWVVAPYTPSLTVYRLGPERAYREDAHVTGDQSWTADAPVAITLCPADLIR